MSAAKQLVDMRFLRTLVPLGELGDAQLQQLMGSYSVELLAAGTELFRKGEHDSFTYYLLSGQIRLIFSDGVEKTVRSQTAQSRYVLVPERPRCATAITTSTTTLLKVNKDTLDRIVGSKDSPGVEVKELKSGNQNDWMTHYLQSKVFLKLRAQNIQALMMRLKEVPVRAGQVIIRQNDDDGYYYIIKQGHCKVTRRNSPHDDEVEQARLTVGTGFGEEAIISHNRRSATVTMINDGLLMRLSRDDFNRILVEPLIKDVIYKDTFAMENVVFLDVRQYDDYVRDGLTDSVNITLFELRGHIDSLDPTKTYVAYSNYGHRAAAAAFLLCQQGLEGIILRAGLDGVPVDAPRGNKPSVDENNIPVVDNVISFDNSKQMVTTPRGLKNESKTQADASESVPFDAEQALQDPRVQALLQHASNNIQQGVEQEKLTDVARQKAEHAVQRLKMEAKLAKRSAEQARRQAEKNAKISAKKADQKAREDAARLRELELGAKQAEMEEAVRQAEDEARRAQEAENARLQAERDNELLKQRLDLAITNAQDEAVRSAEMIRQFAEREEEKQRSAEKTQRELADVSNKEIESARKAAQNEIDVLKLEIESTRVSMRQQAEIETKRAREEAKASAEKIAQQELDRVNSELIKTKELGEKKITETLRIEAEKREAAEQQVHLALQEEMLQISAAAVEQAERAQLAEQANERAEIEIRNIKKDMELVRKQQREASIVAAEQARQQGIQEANEESEKALLEKEFEIAKAIDFAEECSLRARAAEAARDKAVHQAKNLQGDVASTQQQIQADLSQDIARSEIEHEVARARAVELANKQAEIEEIQVHTEEVANRALETERAKLHAEAEVEKLKAEIEQFRHEHQNVGDESSDDQLQRQVEHDEEVRRKQAEIEQAVEIAEQVVERARLAEIAHIEAQQEIQHLKIEVEIATHQAKAQLESDKERSEAQQLEVEQKTLALAEKQAQVISAIERAHLEKRRAKEADLARHEAEQALENYREDAEQHEEIQREISKVRAESISKHVAMEAAAKRARKEAARAEHAERARNEAEQEIVRLKKIAVVQHRKAENAIRQSLEVVNKPAKDTMKSSKRKSENKPQTAKPTKSAWISDHVMWETTLGLRDDKEVSAMIAPDEKGSVKPDPWAEQLLTNISVPLPKELEQSTPAFNERNSLFNRTKFNAREVNHTITAQLDARSYIKRNHAVKKPVIPIITVIAVIMLVAMYYTMSGTQRNDLNDSVKNIMAGKNGEQMQGTQKNVGSTKLSTTGSEPVQSAETIEQRVERNRKRASLSQQRQNIREERESSRLEKQHAQRFKKKRKADTKFSNPVSTSISTRKVVKSSKKIATPQVDVEPVIKKYPAVESRKVIQSDVSDQAVGQSPAKAVVPDTGLGNDAAKKVSPPVDERDILLDPEVGNDKGASVEVNARVAKVFVPKAKRNAGTQENNSTSDVEDVF